MMNLNPAININAERLFTALQDNTVFVKAQNSDDIAKVELDYQTFVQLQELLSSISDNTVKNQKTLYEACMEYTSFGDADFDDIDFDSIRKNQPLENMSELEHLFDD